jgi:hypothetical protein
MQVIFLKFSGTLPPFYIGTISSYTNFLSCNLEREKISFSLCDFKRVGTVFFAQDLSQDSCFWNKIDLFIVLSKLG